MEFKEQLIELVKEHKILYDLSSNDYKNITKKEMVWAEIAKQLNVSVDMCKKTWKSMRDTYKRHKRMNSAPSGSGAQSQKRYKYMDSLDFLSDCTDSRKTVGNISNAESEEAFDLLGCSTSTSVEESTSEVCNVPSSFKTPSKKRSDQKITEDFAATMQQCVGAIERIASDDAPSDTTTELFKTLAKQINNSNLSAQNVRRIERKVVSLVYDEIEKYENENINITQ